MRKTVAVPHLYLKTFILALAGACCIFLPAMIYDQGYFIFVGDFNSQQIPFYMTAHDAVRSGNWGWNWYTDIGANFIGSYTFYLLGSPFFYLTIPFPRSAVPYLMGPLLMLKIACAAVTSCLYLKRYVRNQNFALLGGLLYAFSGFSIYNIFFNHFHEPMVFFPLMLIALDEWMENGRRGVFALAVFVNAILNYFFFVGEVVFIVLYFFVRVFTGSYQWKWSKFITILVEAVIGFLMSSVLMLPSVLAVLQNDRVSNYASGFSNWLYSSNQRIPAIINSFLFPPELPSKQVLLPDAHTKWTSLSAYLPLFSVTGVLTYLQTDRKSWLSRFLLLLLVMALVPVLNSLFVALNASYYARWFYMFVLMLVLATVLSLDRGLRHKMEKNTQIVLCVVVAITLILALTPQFDDSGLVRVGLYDDENWYWFIAIVSFAVLCLLVLLFILPYLRRNVRKFTRLAVTFTLIFSVLYGNIFILWGKTRSYDTHQYIIPAAIEGESKITIPDKDEVIRIDVDDSLINMGMFWNISCMRAFHSIVPGSTMEFYHYLGEKRDVSSKIPESNYAVRGLLSVHWYFDRIDSSTDFGEVDGSTDTLMPGYTYYGDMNGYHVWENDYYIPMGFTYDSYILKSEMDEVADASKSNMMLHAVCLDDDIAYKYADVLTHAEDASSYVCSEENYFTDCQARAAQTVSNVEKDNEGLHCTSDFDTDRFVFFSIPYEDGWSAYIDGEKADLDKVNVGFMGLKVPAGSHQIDLRYETPGLHTGILITFASALLLALYWVVSVRFDKKRAEKEKARVLAEQEETAVNPYNIEIPYDEHDAAPPDQSEEKEKDE